MPMTPSSLHGQALACLQHQDLPGALDAFVRSFEAREPLAEKSLLFALMLLEQANDLTRAAGLLEQAVAAWPEQARWWVALGEKRMAFGDADGGLQAIDQALVRQPDHAVACIHRACWSARQWGDCQATRALFEQWGRRFMDPLTQAAPPLPPRDLSPGRRLRVGYVSGDFKNHSVRYFIEGYLRHHDRAQFDIHAFMTLPGDEVTQWLRPLVAHWHDVADLDDEALWARIRAAGIDVLVDLSGHTHGERLGVFARRAAPVQVTWFGFMQTLGMQAMDWRLSDWGASPPGSEAFYTERLYRLDCMASYTPPLNAEALHESPWHANGYVTLICLNHSRKFSDQALAAWSRILRENPSAGLILISAEADSQQQDRRLLARLEGLDFPMERVTVVGRLNMLTFMQLASVADFALDAFPVSGGTTTLHALWMGLPTLTIDATAQGAQQGATAAIERSCGLGEAVAAHVDEYVERAGQWIRSPQRIDALRQRCRPGLQASALMDHAARTAELERAYRAMWQDWLAAPGAAAQATEAGGAVPATGEA